MAQATLSVRLDSTDKQCFEEFCKSAGLNVSVAINMFVKAVIKEQRIPFTITGDPFYSEKNMNRLKESMHQLEHGKTITKTFHELEELANG